MKHNMGTIDRVLRVIVGIILGYLIFSGKVEGVLAVVLGVFVITLILTSAFGYCPPYSFLGINTCKCEEHSKRG